MLACQLEVKPLEGGLSSALSAMDAHREVGVDGKAWLSDGGFLYRFGVMGILGCCAEAWRLFGEEAEADKSGRGVCVIMMRL